jgi:pimeloyl-ACP methyl ester carboxylesterase
MSSCEISIPADKDDIMCYPLDLCRVGSSRGHQKVMDEGRRTFLKLAGLIGADLLVGAGARQASAQILGIRTAAIQTPVLTIGYEDGGDQSAFPVILLHGFPDDVRAWDEVAPPLIKAGYRVLTPYLRGYGPTRFLDPAVRRTAQQAAIGQDVIDFADALQLPRFALAGYDWGGRAAAITAALHPDRVRAVVLIGGYTIQNTIAPSQPASPEAERRAWYQWYFNTERGRAGLQTNRHAICRFLWQTWSPTWHFSEATFNRTAASFDNPDFVDVVIHSYRHRIGNAPGEPRFEGMEIQLAKRPAIAVPAITLYGADDGIARPPLESPAAERAVFASLVARRVVEGAGHFMPRERPEGVSTAMLELLRKAR